MRILAALVMALNLAACGQANKIAYPESEESAGFAADMAAAPAEAPAVMIEQNARMAQNQPAPTAGEGAGGGVQAQPSQPAGPVRVAVLEKAEAQHPGALGVIQACILLTVRRRYRRCGKAVRRWRPAGLAKQAYIGRNGSHYEVARRMQRLLERSHKDIRARRVVQPHDAPDASHQ